MPAIIQLPGKRTISAPQPRDTPYYNNPPPFPPPFVDPSNNNGNGNSNNNNNDGVPWRTEPADNSDSGGLSPGVIAAIVVAIFGFFLLVTCVFAFLSYRRRKAKQDEIAMKEEAASVMVVNATASGALDPPPPYDEAQSPDHHHHGEREHWPASRSDGTASEAENESEEMGSHATITDGLDPGRHSDRDDLGFRMITGCGII